jgi:Peptidase inhibitor I9
MAEKRKIEGELAEQMAPLRPDEEVLVVVRMRAHPRTTMEGDPARGEGADLKRLAQESQRGLITFLDDQISKGVPMRYKSFYLFNGLSLQAPKRIIEEVAEREDVATIEMNREVRGG